MIFTDAKLMAYAGNELDARDAGALEAMLAADPDLARRAVLALLQRRLGETTAVPATLASHSAAAERHGSRDQRWRMPARRMLSGLRNAWPAAAGLAAVLFVAIGYLAGRQAPEAAPVGLGTLQSAAVQSALDRIPTGGVTDLPDGRFRAVASYIAADGSLCREFSFVDRAGADDAIACRHGKLWAVTFTLLTPPGESEYAPADGGDPVSAYLQGLGAGRPLSARVEKDLLPGSP